MKQLSKAGTVLVVVDVQDKLLQTIHEWRDVLDKIVIMVKSAKILGVPVIITEQYPQGLGPTIPKITEELPEVKVLGKTVFSCFGCEAFCREIEKYRAGTLVLTGIETHICVQQTALSALRMGLDVQIIADAVGSRAPLNKELALARMRQAGAVISSVEMALFEWLERSDCKEFKAVLPFIR